MSFENRDGPPKRAVECGRGATPGSGKAALPAGAASPLIHRSSGAALLVASIALLASCGRESDAVRTDHHDIESREEQAAAEQVRAYLKAVRAGKPRVACKTLVGRAAVRHRCAGRARLQNSLRDLPHFTFGSHFVAYSSPDEMQQAIEIESPRRGALMFDLRRHTPSGEWRIFQIGVGGYG